MQGNDFFFETLRLVDQHEYVWGLLLCIIGSQGCLLFNLPPEGGGEFKQTAALSLQLVAAANSANNSQQISSAAAVVESGQNSILESWRCIERDYQRCCTL